MGQGDMKVNSIFLSGCGFFTYILTGNFKTNTMTYYENHSRSTARENRLSQITLRTCYSLIVKVFKMSTLNMDT